MSVVGYVFLFLTLIASILFPALAQPVVEYRQKAQREYLAEKAKLDGAFENDKFKPGLRDEVVELERERAKLRRLVSQQEERRLLNDEYLRSQQMYRATQTAILVDASNDSKSRGEQWNSVVAQVDGEINARDTELKALDGEVQQVNAFKQELGKEIADLRAKLEGASAEIRQSLADIAKHEKDLTTLTQSYISPGDADALADGNN
jgi:chromosome segregation ATPase